MALQTPGRQRGLQRPSGPYGSAEKSALSASTATARKASLQALTGSGPRTPSSASKMAEETDVEVGDMVNVPGDMYGRVKFVGTVRGKAGTFLGVELDPAFAARGKNSGDVEGASYFTVDIPGSGIFLPISRAEKRLSLNGAFPATPSYTTNGHHLKQEGAHTPPTPSLPAKFSKTVGPGARPSSPLFKPKRPSLPRPESPFRKQPPSLAPTPAKQMSQSVRGARPSGLGSSSMSPSKTNLKASVSRPSASRPYSRTGSRIGTRGDVDEEDRTPVGLASAKIGRNMSTSTTQSFSQTLRSPSRIGSSGSADIEVQRLKKELAERDKRLDEQAASLAEMDASVKELSALIPADGMTPGGSRKILGELGGDDDHTAAQLRQMLREKNEKISMMTREFDSHRADFRSTLDSLEMASTETERVYEEQKRDLLAQVAQLQDENEELKIELGNGGGSKDDLEGITRQLKQLEELVAELEEGLEESRRGEAEARGEVEFLRGEVERGRSELRREREKAAAAMEKNAGGGSGRLAKELEEKDAEIAGLKAIVHNLSGFNSPTTNGSSHDADTDELDRLKAALDESRLEKEDLESQIETLRRETATTNGHTRNESERTATADHKPELGRNRSGTVKAPPPPHVKHRQSETSTNEDSSQSEGNYCEMCESREHDTVQCNKLHDSSSAANDAPAVLEPASTPGKENEGGGKMAIKQTDEDKWCALCEKDGHLAYDCPEEQY
ncbi:dynactin subunit 1-like [Teratosphaeria destructans]|uniref:Dynactin subunit 1-like n=1 Tax=Teratosphaeria destructans TaxID=418781 RepID=A0A9W7SY30_9PEZI|nr:dynactin subunit 1-like [Teratosphaeria destructans]